MKRNSLLTAITLLATVVLTGCSKDEEPPVPVITISTQPIAPAATLVEGSVSGSLTIAATATEGATLTYQWYTNTTASNTGGTTISGATSASYILPNTLTAGTYYYFCEVSAKGAAPVRSSAVTVTVDAPQPPPANNITFTTTYTGDVDNLYLWGTGEATIDWGDGSTPQQVALQALPAQLSEYPDGTKITHTWAAGDVPPSRTVTITGTVTGLATPGTMAGTNSAEAANMKGITTLNLRGMASLEYLKCRSERITALDVSSNPALKFLACDFNYSLTSLDLSNCPALTWLSTEETGLTTLNISANTALVVLGIGHNPSLPGLTVSHLVNLETLYLNNVAGFTTLDIRGLNKLKYLAYSSNPNLAVQANWGELTDLIYLWCANNNLDKAALMAILTALPDRTGKDTPGELDCLDNPGYNDFSTEQSAAAAAKNWIITGALVPPAVDILTTDNFPDDKFRTWLTAQTAWDTNGDGILSRAEAEAVTKIIVVEEGITSLDGIELFSKLTRLDCYSNKITELDVSGLTNLTWLDCYNNKITELDVSGLTNLTVFGCTRNKITELKVAGLANLTEFHCDNNLLTELDVTGLTSLKWLICHDNQIAELDASGLTALAYLHCQNNQIEELKVAGLANLTELECYRNLIKVLDLSGLTALTALDCANNLIPELNVAGLTNLKTLYCPDNQIKKLDASGLTNLASVSCYSNQISELNVAGLTSLLGLDCDRNKLTELNLTGLTNLASLYCYNNQISELNVSGQAKLTRLDCYYNLISELDVSANSALTTLRCGNDGTPPLTVLVNEQHVLGSAAGQLRVDPVRKGSFSGRIFERDTEQDGVTVTNKP